MTIEAGSKLGPYEILSPIGAGGMGEVFKARDTRLDREVAIKVLPDTFARDEQFLQRFEREAKTISSLNHPNICVLHDIGEQDGHRYLVMELIDGESLADRLAKGPLPIDQAIRLGGQVAQALDKAHRQGIVHRDLKPGNVMITKTGAKLLDFGLAKTSDAVLFGSRRASGETAGGTSHDQPTQQKPLTQEGTILGTFQYMAPEQLEGTEADVRTDIFALGALLYEMATGQKAFSGKSRASLIASILDHQPPTISSVRPMTPPAFDHLVRRCLEKDPEDRWQSAHDVASELRWIGEAGSQAGVAAPVTMRRKTRERTAWALAAVMFALLAALAFVHFRPTNEIVTPALSSLLPPAGLQFSFSGLNVTSLAVSPDGKKVAFPAPDENGQTQLYIRFLDILEPRRLGGTTGATNPFWSPDSRFVAFFADGKLKKVDINGAPPLTVTTASGGRSGSWNGEGVIIFSPSPTEPIHRVAATGGESVPVTKIDASRGETTHRWAHFLPDGKHFLFLAGSHSAGGEIESNAVYAASLDSVDDRKIVVHARSNAVWANGHILYLRDRILVAQPFDATTLETVGEAVPIAEGIAYATDWFGGAFSASGNGVLVYATGAADDRLQLTWLDRKGVELGTVGRPSNSSRPILSPDDTRAAMEIDDPNGSSDLWLVDLERDVTSRFTFEEQREMNPAWSPDGTTIAYGAGIVDPNGIRAALKLKATSGSGEPEMLWEASGPAAVRGWAADGRHLLISARASIQGGANDLFVIDLEGDRTPRELLAREFDEPGGYLSPDGRWLAFVSNESGQYQLYVTSFPEARGKWQVSREGTFQGGGAWRGNEIFYKGPAGRIDVARVEERGDSLAISNPVTLFENLRIDSFDVSHDGQRILANLLPEQGESQPMTMVTNWTALLERK
jgi:eukaryotic-like serine/threonine-protein kinase